MSHLPKVVNAFLGKKHAKPRPRRLPGLHNRTISVDRKMLDTSLTNKRLRQFCLHNNATKLINQTRHLRNVSENQTLQTLAGELHNNLTKVNSVTCMTGTNQHLDIMQGFNDFMKHDRTNAFKVEDFYFLKNNLPSRKEQPAGDSPSSNRKHTTLNVDLPTTASMQKSMREFAADNDVIHVTIDRSSLQQLTKLSDHDIKQDENVKLVTSKKEGQ